MAFVQRPLAREGLLMRLVRSDDVPLGHVLVPLADSVARACGEQDPANALGVRDHASGAQEQQDATQTLGSTRALPATARAPARRPGCVPGRRRHPGDEAFADPIQAARSALLMQ